MKHNTYFKGDGGSCIDLLITNWIYEGKCLWNWFDWSFKPKKAIYRNLKQYDQFKLDIFNSMSAMKTHAAFKNNFVWTLYKHAHKKTKNLRGNQKPHFNERTFRNQWWSGHVSKTKQISQKNLVTLPGSSDIKICWEIWINMQNCSNLRNLVLVIIPDHFWKHVDHTSQVIYKKI